MRHFLKKNTIFKICIVKLSAMGDIIHAMVALQFIKKSFPYAQIDWLVEDNFKGVLENNPHIDNILAVNLKSIKKNKSAIFNQIKLLNQYAKNNYDLVIDAQGLIKSAIVSKILGNKFFGNNIIGFDSNSIRENIASLFYNDTVSIRYEKNVIDRNIEILCKSLNINVTREEILAKKKFLFSTTSNVTIENTIIFVIAASKENKIYPKEHFLEIAKLLNEKILVVWGNAIEFEVAKWLSDKSTLIQTTPKGDLNDLKNTISNARLVIGADTGPTHMAWALNVPSITIFGNTPEYRNTYITDINKVIKSHSIVNPLKLDKNDFSICDIQASEIVKIAKGLLQ